MNQEELIGTVEAIIFASGEPIATDRIAQVLGVSSTVIIGAVDILKKKYSQNYSGIRLIYLENKVQFASNPAYIEPVRATLDLKRNTPLSQAALEVIAIVAYNQPVTKAFIEQVRGVDCSGVVGSLIQKGLLEERGRLELPGRPLLYGTTDHLLLCLGISSLDELPAPTEKKEDKTEESVQLEF